MTADGNTVTAHSKARSSGSDTTGVSSTSSRVKVKSTATTIKAALAVVVGIIGAFQLVDAFKDRIANYDYAPRQGLHNPMYGTVAVLVYLLFIYDLIPRYMKDRQPKSFTVFKTIHNYFLTVFSFTALFFALKAIASIWNSNPDSTVFGRMEALLCDSSDKHSSNGNLYFWLHVYYLSKFYEFIDTALICFSKKKPIFLHVYHHIITLWTIWMGMDHGFAGQWVIMIANCFIHVFMYYYYMLQTLGVSVWWKRYLTSMQIVQFALDEFSVLSWAYFVLVEGVKCKGHWFSFWFAFSVITSFLVLFTQFYFTTYNPSGRPTGEQQPKQKPTPKKAD